MGFISQNVMRKKWIRTVLPESDSSLFLLVRRLDGQMVCSRHISTHELPPTAPSNGTRRVLDHAPTCNILRGSSPLTSNFLILLTCSGKKWPSFEIFSCIQLWEIKRISVERDYCSQQLGVSLKGLRTRLPLTNIDLVRCFCIEKIDLILPGFLTSYPKNVKLSFWIKYSMSFWVFKKLLLTSWVLTYISFEFTPSEVK